MFLSTFGADCVCIGDMKRLGLVDPDSVQTSTTLSNVDSPPSVLGSPSHPDYTFEVPPPSIRSSQLDLSTGKGGAEDLIPATSHASSLDKPGIQPPGTSHEAVHLRQEAGAAVKTPCGEGAHRRGLRPTTKARVAPGVDGSRRKHSQYYQAEYPGRQVSLESKNDVRDLISLVYRNLDRLDNHPSNKPAKK